MKTRKPCRAKTYFRQHEPLMEPDSPFAKGSDYRAPYIPTPEQIEAACAEIQRGWRWDDERTINEVATPMVSARDFRLTVDCSVF